VQIVYKKVNEKVENSYDEYSKEYAEIFEKDLGLNKGTYPLVTKEKMYYQVVPCVELSYKHMLTNTTHEFAIIDIWDNPEIIFHSEPEPLKQDLGNVTKSVGGFFGKLFKTKEDKKNEITLLIYLAKADGKIEEKEKLILSTEIGHIDDFTNSEKQKLFDLMNSATLPPLTKNETTFSSKERANEVLEKLTKLAMADGEFDIAEKELIDKIKVLIE
jgi:tellurite resistance protein